MWLPLSTTGTAEPALVGGKSASLIRLTQSGFRVPAGVVLTTAFFEDWIAQIGPSEAWQAVTRRRGDPDAALLGQACDALKKTAASLPLSSAQREALRAAWAELGAGRFAVRSSSPEEDLEGASFAGLYETVLHVAGDALEPAIRACFQSCLDGRVLLYKREMGFADLSPSIAVVVQRQIDSETSGVAFSLNPLNDDHDELVINASWGLGEALVSGELTPDTVVVDKVSGDVVDRRLGDKGGDRSAEPCLDAAGISALRETVCAVAQVYGTPVDVEWAFSAEELHVLQARPITTFVPIPEGLATEPGAPRVLYLDGAISDGLTLSGAISPMTNDTVEQLFRAMMAPMFGCEADEVDLDLGGMHFAGARIYLNLSMYMHLMGSSKRVAQRAESMNALMAAILSCRTTSSATAPRSPRSTSASPARPGPLSWPERPSPG